MIPRPAHLGLPLALAVALGLGLGACPGSRSRGPGKVAKKSLDAALAPFDGVTLTTGSAWLEPLPAGGQVVEWVGLARNDGPSSIARLSVEVVALDAGGRELGRDFIDAVGIGAQIGWLHPGASVEVSPRSQGVYSESPASLRIEVGELAVSEDPAAPVTPLEFAWRGAAPPAAAVELHAAWCGAAIGDGRGRTPFDCQFDLENRGEAPLELPTIEFVFEDASGAVVDRLPVRAPSPGPIAPGVRLAYAAARAIAPHARYRVELAAP
ncbi:MAG: hypothetical protein R3B09_14415 [Nannocystaceae bacterium]